MTLRKVSVIKCKIIYYVMYLTTTAMKAFIHDKVEPTLSREQVNIKLDGVAHVFRESLEEMDKLDMEIEKIAVKLIPSNWSPETDALQKDRGFCIIYIWKACIIDKCFVKCLFTDRKGERGIMSDHVLQKKQLTLKDLQEKAKAP